MSQTDDTSRREIHRTLDLCNFCTRMIGLSFIDEPPTSVFAKIKTTSIFVISALALILLVVGEIAYVTSLILRTTSVAEFVTSLHIVGYGSMSISKLLTLWFKRHTFRKLIEDLEDIWPVAPENQEEEDIKQKSLKDLRLGQSWYAFFNVLGVVMYNITPIGIHLYRRSRGMPSVMGYVWHVAYPFDKTQPINHVFVYAFECFAGASSMWSMVSSDMIFTTMASHIGLLLRVLQVKIRRLGLTATDGDASPSTELLHTGYYQEIVNLIKIHQRLISYSDDLEETFSLVNLINVMLSSVNICCVMFVIVLLEPWMAMSNKFFMGAALTQVGILCWYADEIYRASVGVADAVYASGWYRGDARSRRALVVLIQRSQKPLYFTALKFRPITMTTYSSIITTSYSYFTLLYTVYRSD
uniref:Odorant receptor n=1 Tax=Epiphyas postvittana TaxID=65032 RepID=A0A0K8TVB7_EPIPO